MRLELGRRMRGTEISKDRRREGRREGREDSREREREVGGRREESERIADISTCFTFF